MPRWLKWALGGVLAVFIACGAGLMLFDWNLFRAPLSSRLSEHTGRPVSIDGDLRVNLGRFIRISANQVRFGNATWSRDPDMLRFERIDITVDALELLHLRLALPEITLVQPAIALERNKQGEGNWHFNTVANSVALSTGSSVPSFGRLVVEDGRLTFRDPAKGIDITTKIATAVGKADKNKDRIELHGRGTIRNHPLRFDVTGASILTLRDSAERYPLQGTLVVGGTTLSFNGTMQDPAQLTGADLAISVRGPSLGEALPLFGIPAPQTPPYRIAGRLGKDGEVWSAQGLSGEIGATDIAGQLRFDDRGNRLQIAGNLASRQVDYKDIGPLLGLPPLGVIAKPLSVNQQRDAAAYRADTRIFPDAKLQIDQIKNVDADLQYRADKIDGAGIALQNINLKLHLKDGVLALQPLDVAIAGGRMTADVAIDTKRASVRTNYDLRLTGFDLAQLSGGLGAEKALAGSVRARIKMIGDGDSVRASLASANGEVSLVVDGGQISELGTRLIGLDIAKSLGLAITGDKQVPIRCIVVDAPVRTGLIEPKIFVVDTAVSTITGEGAVDLGQETLKLTLQAHPKSPTLSVRSPIEVGGTLKQPTLRPEVGPVAARAGGAIVLGALLSPLATILAFIDPGMTHDSDCSGLIAATPVAPMQKRSSAEGRAIAPAAEAETR
jgi:hypothetical protein